MSAADKPAVVILGVNEMALASARSLAGRHGVRTIAVELGSGERPPAGYSWHLEFRRGPAVGDEALLPFLERLAEELTSRPVLLPVGDAATLLIHRHRARLAQHYRFCIWGSELFPELGSKLGLAAVAARYALPVPETFAARDRADVDARVGALRFPLLVKPEYSSQWWTAEALALGLGRKAIRVADHAELRDVVERSASVGARVVVQRIVGGEDSDHWSYAAFVRDDGRTSSEVLVRKLRIFPPRFGIGSYVVTAEDEEVRALGRAILARIGFRGFASVQIKREGQGGALYLIEINLRLPTWIALAAPAGVDVAWDYYRACLGLPSEAAPAKLGVRWMSWSRDWRSMRECARDGVWSWGRWLRQALAAPVVPIFAWSDPVPALVALWRHLCSFARERALPAAAETVGGEALPAPRHPAVGGSVSRT